MKKYIHTKIQTLVYSVLFLFALPFTSQAHFGSKGPFGGTITCTTIAGDTVYMGTAEGGVFESTSSALVGWRARPVGLKSGKITAIAHTGKYLFAATADSGIFMLNGYVGSDRYWNKVNTGLTNLNVTSLLAINATTVLAGTTDGLFLTTNSGTSWTAVNGDLHHLDIAAIEQAGSRIFIAARDGGVYMTANNGTSWAAFNDVHTEHVDGTVALSYNSSTDELMVLNENGLYIAANATTAITAVFTTATTGISPEVLVRSISNNGNAWYLATDHGIYISLTNTISWTLFNNAGLTTLDIRTIKPFGSGWVCGTRQEGIFKMMNPATTWSAMNVNFNNLKTTAMAASGAGFIVAATEKGVYVSTDIAASYVSANKGLTDSLYVNDLILAKHFLVAATENGGVFITADSGKQWTAINTGLVNLHVKKIFYSNDMLHVFDSDGFVYSTNINTINWQLNHKNLTIGGFKPTSMAFYGNNILLGSLGEGVFIKTESGLSWAAYNTGLSNLTVTSVTTLGTKLYVGTDGSGVFISDSAKAQINWTATAPTAISHTSLMSLKGSNIQAMASYAGYVWASYKGGLLASSDHGVTWIAGGNQFNLPSFTDVTKINFVTTRVFVSTENNGLYSNGLAEIPSVVTSLFAAAAVNTTALGIAPNPTSGEFKLDTKNISGSIEEIVIYDYAGNIKNHFTQEQDLYRVSYNQGMYVVQVSTSEGIVYTQKMIIK